MLVRELIETNGCIVEAYITLRGEYTVSPYNNNKRTYNESEFVHDFAIGTYATLGENIDARYMRLGNGERGSKFSKPYTIINKELNARANQSYWSVKINAIPTSVQEMEVRDWSTTDAYMWRKHKGQTVGYEAAQVIYITVYLPPDQVLIEEKVDIKNNNVPIEGQMNILEMF